MYTLFERRLEEILRHIGDFPRTLALRQQGLFALGYYHQRAADAEEMRQAVERNKQRALIAAQQMAFGFVVDGLIINSFAFFWRDDSSELPRYPVDSEPEFWPALLGIEFLLIQLTLLGVIRSLH